MRGHPLEHRRRPLPGADARREDHQALRRNRGELRVGTRDAGVRDLVTHLHLGHVRPDGRHGTAGLEPERHRELGLVQTGAVIHVDVVEPGSVDPDDRFACLRLGLGHVLVLQHVGATGSVDTNRFHGVDLRERIRSAQRIIAPVRDRTRGGRSIGAVTGDGVASTTPGARLFRMIDIGFSADCAQRAMPLTTMIASSERR